MTGQAGAFHDLEKAKACADSNPGYSVYDESGKVVYTTKSAAKYTVQAGSFSKKENAAALKTKLEKAGFSAFYYLGSDGEYKVQVGAYDKAENAKAQVARLKAAGFEVIVKS